MEEQPIVKQVLGTVAFPFLNREQSILDKIKNILSENSVEIPVSITVSWGELKVHYIQSLITLTKVLSYQKGTWCINDNCVKVSELLKIRARFC